MQFQQFGNDATVASVRADCRQVIEVNANCGIAYGTTLSGVLNATATDGSTPVSGHLRVHRDPIGRQRKYSDHRNGSGSGRIHAFAYFYPVKHQLHLGDGQRFAHRQQNDAIRRSGFVRKSRTDIDQRYPDSDSLFVRGHAHRIG